MRRRFRRYRLRHKTHTTKNKTKQIAACSAQKKYPLRFVKRFGLVPFAKRRSEHESVFTTNNTRPNQKIDRLNQSALVLRKTWPLQRRNAPSVHAFSSFSQNHNRSTKQPKQTIRSINRKINHKNNHISQQQNQSQKQSRQTIQNLSIRILSRQTITQTTTTNYPHNQSINNTLKTKHDKQTRKTISSINLKINHITSTTN